MVSQKTIGNCFRHACFHISSESKEILESVDEDISLTELPEKLQNPGCADESRYINIDEDLALDIDEVS